MRKLILALGTSALIFALADGIHGQHNGDNHRFYIHIAEGVSFFGFLCVLAVQAFKTLTARLKLSRWLSGFVLSFGCFLLGSGLSILAGGSAHGDGGPIVWSFAVMGLIGTIGIPLSIVGLLFAAIERRYYT